MASQITGISTICLTAFSGSKWYQNFALLPHHCLVTLYDNIGQIHKATCVHPHYNLNKYIHLMIHISSFLIASQSTFRRVFENIDIQYITGIISMVHSLLFLCVMMTSSNGNIFRVTGPLCGEFTGHRWIPLTKASDAELWYFLSSAPEQTVE